MVDTKTPVGNLRMIGSVYESKLKRLNILTVEDLLLHIPFRYENFSLVSKISRLQEGEIVTVKGKIDKFENIYTKTGKKIQKLKVSDETGSTEAIFFNQTYLSNIFKDNAIVTLAGEVKRYINNLSFISPQYEVIRQDSPLLHTGRLVSVYPETEGLSSKWLRSRIAALILKLHIKIPEFIPPEITKKFGLLSMEEAINTIHFPKSLKDAQLARQRLSFNELLLINLASILRKQKLKSQKTDFNLDLNKFKSLLDDFISHLPFSLTAAQIRVLDEVLKDLVKTTPMNRLLEGDVGSGKTIIAVICSYFISLNGYKVLLMAPTEILAKQHFFTFKRYLQPLNIGISLITSKEKTENLNTENQKTDIFIGTHALLFHNFSDEKIALVIIDEQQRFGVKQRSQLRSKSLNSPHLLSMTATPIPRTVALTLYSDLDLSVIDQMPKGRKRIKTFVVPLNKREAAYRWIEKEIIESRHTKKTFIICPLIDESETLKSVRSVKKEFEILSKEIFPSLNLDLLHGRMSPSLKDKIMERLINGPTDILVATPVVEVGIDIKSATIIMIEAAERFGLAQLHQLRGRVGRGDKQSYCLLFTQSNNPQVINRLKMLEIHHIGIKLAEDDLRLRGPGQFFGIEQHGRFGLKFTDMADLPVIKIAKVAAIDLLKKHNTLNRFPLLREKLLQYTIPNISLD